MHAQEEVGGDLHVQVYCIDVKAGFFCQCMQIPALKEKS